jgi:hypothetical protein
MPRPRRSLVAALSALFLAFVPSVRAENVFVDRFDDGDPLLADSRPGFWTLLQPEANLDSSVTESDGALRLRAATWANTYAGVVSPALEDFGFFTRPVTITLDGLALEAKGIEPGEARFKLSFSAKSERAERAEDVISLRLRPGLLLLGYRLDGFELGSAPETLSGRRANSVLVQEINGLPSRLTLTLGPAQTPGHVRYDLVAEGEGVSVRRSGTLAVSLADWGGIDAAALGIDTRRDSTSTRAGTYAELTARRVTVSR